MERTKIKGIMDISKNVSVKGRIKRSLDFWEKITKDNFVLGLVEEGFKLPFFNFPPRGLFH